MVDELNRSCAGCGFKIVIETDAAMQEKYLRRPSLGALLFTQGWALGSRLYIWFLLSLVPIVGIVALIMLTIFGRRWSWRRGAWASFEEFRTRMRLLDAVGVMWVVILAVGYFLFRK